jgi:hypothetical protein
MSQSPIFRCSEALADTAHSAAHDIRLCPTNQPTMRDLVLRFEMKENDINIIPSNNNEAPTMRKCGGAGSQGLINRKPFGLTDNMANLSSVGKRTLMPTATNPIVVMSHPVIRTMLRRNWILSRRSNRRAASTLGGFKIKTPAFALLRQTQPRPPRE